jgi:hypothetical protein
MLIFVSRRGVDFLFLFWKGFGTFLVWFFLRYLGFCLSCRFFGFGEVLLTICSRFCGSGFSVLEKVYFRYFPVLRISLFWTSLKSKPFQVWTLPSWPDQPYQAPTRRNATKRCVKPHFANLNGPTNQAPDGERRCNGIVFSSIARTWG